MNNSVEVKLMLKLLDKKDFATVPRWARVSLAVRAATRVHPLLSYFWQDISENDARIVAAALQSARTAAMNAKSLESGAEQEVGGVRLLATAKCTQEELGKEEQIRIACAAKVVASAQQALGAASEQLFPNGDVSLVRHACDASVIACEAISEAAQSLCLAACQIDLDALTAKARANNWTDHSPVDPDSLGELWPQGIPVDWP